MRTVFKYPIPATGDVRIELPMNAKLVLCDTQGASFNPVLWFEIERDNDHEMRTFRVFGTGHDIPDGYEHMGSVNHEMTGLVWHVYEKSDTETRRWSDDLTDRERIIANTSPDGLWAAASLRSEVSEPLYVCNKCGFSGTTSPHRGCNYFAAPAPSEGIETPPSDPNFDALIEAFGEAKQPYQTRLRALAELQGAISLVIQQRDDAKAGEKILAAQLATMCEHSDTDESTIVRLRADLEAANRETPPSEVMSRLANLGIDSDDLIGTIRSLRTDLEAANRERDELAKWVELAEKKISDSDAQLEAANTIINAWVRHSPMCSILIKPSCDCGLHAALSSYRRSPDSNTETRR
jgi:hypothetical protein